MKHNLETLRKEMTIGTKESAMDELNEVEKELQEMRDKHSPLLKVTLHTIIRDIIGEV